MEPASTLRFSTAARSLAHAARAAGLVAPGFRSPPRVVGADRTLRRGTGGRVVVAVRVHGRPWVPVLADMVEGVVAANRLRGPGADRAREALWAAVAAELEPSERGEVALTGNEPGQRARPAGVARVA